MLYEFGVIIVRGVAIGSLFAIIAMSFNIVHNATRILNFAQGNIFILGGFAVYFLAQNSGLLHWGLMAIVAGFIIAGFSAAQGWLTLWPLREDSASQDSWMISTVSVSVIIAAVLMLVYGPFAYAVRDPLPKINLFGVTTPGAFFAAILAMFVCYGFLQWFLKKTLSGLAISALSQDYEAARAAGLNVKRLQLTAFAISGLIVGISGFVLAPIVSVSPDAGLRYVMNGFIAAVVGGIGNNTGALIGGPLIGVMAMLTAYQIGGAYQDLGSLIILVAILMFWPQGLFGKATARRV